MKELTILFFGSFNPMHNGHVKLIEHMMRVESVKELRVIVSPQSPFKAGLEQAAFEDRLTMCRLATKNLPFVKVSDIEGKLDKPSYTYNTISHLTATEPQTKFALLIGKDNLAGFSQWKNYERILNMVPLFVFPRSDHNFPKVHFSYTQLNSPLFSESSTEIRRNLIQGLDVSAELDPFVLDYIRNNHLYK